MLLERRDAAFGIEDDGTDCGPAFRCAADRTAGIARGRGEDGQRVGGVALARRAEAVETGHQEARAEILEGAGRAVEQLEHAAAVGEGFDLNREIEGGGTNGVKVGFEFIAREEGGEKFCGEVGEGQRGVERGGVGYDLALGQIQSAIGRRAIADCLRQRNGGRLAAGAGETHQAALAEVCSTRAPAESIGAR